MPVILRLIEPMDLQRLVEAVHVGVKKRLRTPPATAANSSRGRLVNDEEQATVLIKWVWRLRWRGTFSGPERKCARKPSSRASASGAPGAAGEARNLSR